MKGHWLRDQRGTVIVFAIIVLALFLIIGGIAVDLAYHSAARGELQRSMDAASLAGAGKLGFDDTVFPLARQFSRNYANLNPYRVGTITLDPNDANDPNGDITLGIWEGGAFTPSLDGTRVNAVKCQYTTQISTSFLRLLGFNALPVSAAAVAVSNPPLVVPPETCVFPIALSGCAFEAGGTFSSQGCGAPITFISSSGASPGPPPGTNTASWANLCSVSTPSVPETRAAIQAAADPNRSCSSCIPTAGEDQIGTNNGMQQSVFDLLEQVFVQQFSNGETYTVTDSNGDSTYTNGRGWKVYVPVIDTSCPPGAITGPHTVTGWTEFVMTQVINKGKCAVDNPLDTNSASLCPNSGDPALRAVFGYYSCKRIESPQIPDPAPRAALGNRLRLVR